jgi:hypothetical protein
VSYGLDVGDGHHAVELGDDVKNWYQEIYDDHENEWRYSVAPPKIMGHPEGKFWQIGHYNTVDRVVLWEDLPANWDVR